MTDKAAFKALKGTYCNAIGEDSTTTIKERHIHPTPVESSKTTNKPLMKTAAVGQDLVTAVSNTINDIPHHMYHCYATKTEEICSLRLQDTALKRTGNYYL